MTASNEPPGSPRPSSAPTLLVDGSTTAPAMPADAGAGPLQTGVTFARRYHVRRQLGTGGMGAVYQAWDTDLSEDVAIKVIRPDLLHDRQAAIWIEQRFKRELLLARRVSHPSVVRIHDTGEVDGLRYLTMSYVEGRDLATVMDADGPMSAERVIRLGQRMGTALVAIHAAGVLHRDLKPANVMLGRGDAVWLMDFGVACLATDAQSGGAAPVNARLSGMTELGSRVGTLAYMAPEQARGERVDERADVYALGLILYDLLSGGARERAYAQSAEEFAAREHAPPRRIRALVPDVPDALDELLARALDPEPARRFQTAAAMVEALGKVPLGDGVGGPRTSASTADSPLAARTDAGAPAASAAGVAPTIVRPGTSRRTVLIGGASALVLAAGAGLYAWRRATPPARAVVPNGVLVLPFLNLSGNPEQDYFADGLAAEVRAALTRNRALRVIAQASSDAVRRRNKDAVQMAADVGVAYLLDGSVRLGGGTFRIVAELIDGLSGFSRWSETFDRPIGDVLKVQSEIASTVQAALAATLGAGSSGGPTGAKPAHEPGGTDDVAAFDAYLRGRALYDQSDGEASDRAALAQFEAAIARDPKFAAAHAARSRSLTVIANQYASATQTPALYEEALREAQLAVALAPDFAGAHSTLAFTLFQGRLDVAAARAPYERSRELGAGDATVLGRYALYCALTGRADDALASMRRAAELDPLNPLIHRAVGSVHYAARNYAEVLPNVRHALALNPKLSGAHAIVGNALLMLGRTEEARAEYRSEQHALVRLPGLAIVERRLGDAAASRVAFDELVRTLGDGALYQQAQVHAQWGEADAAVVLLEQARAAGDSGLIYLRTDPLLDPLRARPEVKGLLERLGFT
jgi:TolB-like protein/Flp pilus assembly protein TadD